MSTKSDRYNPSDIEAKWYEHWMKHNYFHSEPDDREPFTIVIPPPNVTGVLHMGHMLNNTIQDILIRKARLEGKNACWVPGTDHASIATEAKVVKMLRAQGIKKGEIGRTAFLKHAFEWKDKYGGIILEQLKRLGASCDWERTRFTMEESMSKAVLKVFVDLYRKGKIYRGLRMTNWDPEAQTVLSNEEVIHAEENAQLVHIRYDFEDQPGEGLVIATQRPETIMADVAIAVNPEDDRFSHLIGKKVVIPLIDRAIPIIGDTYVDVEFGTGALKITPAHDQNDNEIGERHGLEVIDILTPDGKINDKGQILVGQDRFEARKNIKKMLKESGHLIKVEDYRTKIGRSERTNAVVEPRLTLQWFVDMKGFAATALKAVKSGDVKFFPENMWNMFYSWLNEENVRDWCISRQLWWGQQIPAYYYEDHVFVAEHPEQALAEAQLKTGNSNLTMDDLKQDEDVVDTWFSSWLWPMSVFDGFETPEELKYYYPTNVLVTGWDIMFFWVARMIMAGYEWSGELLGGAQSADAGSASDKTSPPFKDVYFTGMVRDNKRRKMSKSLGNSPDALALIDNYGADGVRFGMLSSAAAGNDIIFDAPFDEETNEVLNESKLCEQGLKFCNKMWNGLRAIKGWSVVDTPINQDTAYINALAKEWFENRLNQALQDLEQKFEQYRLSDALITLYSLIWNDFFSWYLEVIKPPYGEPIDRATLEKTLEFYERIMTVLHPFMPFVTEEIWHELKLRAEGEDCIVSAYPMPGSVDKTLLNAMERAKDLVTNIRDLRSKHGVSSNEPLALAIEESTQAKSLYETNGLKELVQKMAKLSKIEFTQAEVAGSVAFLSGTENYYLELNIEVDTEAERQRIEEEIKYQEGFKASAEKKLGNERFVSGAPPAVVEKERKKVADADARLAILKDQLGKL
jgi:valyl-tRNA synthetase